MLTNAAVKAAAPRSRAYKLADERGLHLFVTPTGRKSWRMKYRVDRREQLLTFGRYPEMSLADARARCDQVRAQLRSGADPRGTGAAAEQLDTLEKIARTWHAGRLERWSPKHAGDVIESLENHVFPSIGAKCPDVIDEAQILELLGRLEARGHIETARRVRQRLEAIFRFARRRRRATIDPTDVVDELAVRPPARPMPALVTAAECRELLEAIAAANAAPKIKRGAAFLALTVVRMGTLRAMRWRELEDLDGDAPIWRIPAAQLKLIKAKKGEARFDLVVPLVPAAVQLLRAAAAENGHDTRSAPADALVFPIGEAAIGDLIARAGFKGRHVPHGWRASFSTILNELMPGERDAIDAALGHRPKRTDIDTKVEGAYNRSVQLSRRRALFEAWAGVLAPPAA